MFSALLATDSSRSFPLDWLPRHGVERWQASSPRWRDRRHHDRYRQYRRKSTRLLARHRLSARRVADSVSKPRALENRLASRSWRQGPERAAPVALQPRSAESIGGFRQGVSFHEARLERDRDGFRDAARPQFCAAGVLERLRNCRGSASRALAAAADLREQRLDAIRLALD